MVEGHLTQTQKMNANMSEPLPYVIQEYRTLQLLGEGGFGKVLHCFKPHTPEAVAVKIMKEDDEETFREELRMLHHVGKLDPDRNNIVKFIDSFVWEDQKCLVFEMLDISLEDMLDKRGTLLLSDIRPIAQQLLVAFDGLKQLGVVHTDLKLDNVMLVDQKFHPLKVKLIDFGVAYPKSELKLGMQVQPNAFQAPEVSLGLPLSEAIDMWSLGCVLVHLYLGSHPFSGLPYRNQRSIIEALGFPPNELLSQGIFTNNYYSLQDDGQWRFKTPEEFKRDTGMEPLNGQGPLQGFSLDEAIRSYPPIIQNPEFGDRMNFLSLCKCLLHLDYRERITPSAALYHPFITMEFLEEDQSDYANNARDKMAMVINNKPSGPLEPATKEEPKEKTPNQCDFPEWIEDEDQRLPEYRILKILGEGMFGQVLHCFKPQTSEIVAVKVIKDDNQEAFENEVHMIHHVRELDPDKHNIVKFIDSFVWNNENCLAFEMLDMSLHDMMTQRQVTLSLSEIRPIAQQLLVAFEGLKDLGVVHTDLKLDNVMLVNQKHYPFKVKLIDFGVAYLKSELKLGMQVQPNTFQAPEVSLGLPLSEAIDMWSLGCILVHLYLGVHPFFGTPYENQMTIIDALGFPPNDILNQGIFTKKFYTQEEDGQWRLKTPEEIQKETGLEPLDSLGPLQGFDLEQAIESYPPIIENPEFKDRMTFVSLCKCLLHLDYRERITPSAALYHPFITMEYLEEDQSDYVNRAQEIMAMVINNNPNGPQEPTTKEEPKETTQNKCDFLHPSGEYEWIEDEDQPLPEYRILKTLGEGMFGQVLHCFKPQTSEIVAVKVIKNGNQEAFEKEVRMIHHVRELDPDKHNIVKFIDSFLWNNENCLAFEMLDISLKDMMTKWQVTLSLSEIRPIAQQLLVAFEGLKELGVVHTDLKLDNVMLVNQKHYPFKVKLIDFGVAYLKSELKLGMQVQPSAYQAPEVSLGLPLSEAIDMWSLGCVLVHLYLGVHPFFGTPYENQMTIIDALGFPPNDILNQGIFTKKFYTQEEDGQWQLKTPEEIQKETGLEPLDSLGPLQGFDLEQAIRSYPPIIENPEFKDRLTFVSLCKCLLHLDYRERITPSAALYHPFITMEYLEEDQSDYVNRAQEIMAMVINNNPNGPQEPTTKEDLTDTSQNQCDFLHPSGEYEWIEDEDQPLPEYRILKILGEGMFGQVLHCFKPQTSEIVAVKVIKNGNQEAFEKEVRMIHHVRELDPDKHNIVKFIDSFLWNNENCLAFEMLDISLKDMMTKWQVTLSLSEIRPIAQQLLVAFEGLKELGVVHTDLKLDNVMLVNQKHYPFKVKLIDFGVAYLKSELKLGMQVQPSAYQAPEVSLGLPLSEAIDMWSLGCILVHLYLGVHPFFGTPYENQMTIIDALGFPPNDILNQGIFTKKFYTQEEDGQWQLKTPEEIQKETGLEPLDSLGPLQGFDLEQAIKSYPPIIENPEFKDRLTFVSLCKCLLHLDYRERITPTAALYHPFITMEFLEEDQSGYANWAQEIIAMAINNNPSGPQEPTTKGEPKETTQNQWDSLHTHCIEGEENLLEQSQHTEEKLAMFSFKLPLLMAVYIQHQEEEHFCDGSEVEINSNNGDKHLKDLILGEKFANFNFNLPLPRVVYIHHQEEENPWDTDDGERNDRTEARISKTNNNTVGLT